MWINSFWNLLACVTIKESSSTECLEPFNASHKFTGKISVDIATLSVTYCTVVAWSQGSLCLTFSNDYIFHIQREMCFCINNKYQKSTVQLLPARQR